MRICRYNDNSLGLVKGDQLIDVTLALDVIPETRWPKPHGDAMIAKIEEIKPKIKGNQKMGYVQGVNNVILKSPVANPTKIIAASANYRKLLSAGPEWVDTDLYRKGKTVQDKGLFLKASTSLVGSGEGVSLAFNERDNDHAIELAIIIGKTAKNIPYQDALKVVAGYSIGLNHTLQGREDPSLRKSIDSYSVLGPWMTTADEIENPDNLNFRMLVNGEVRQQSNTQHLVFNCRRLIEFASRFYTLYPGDIIMTGAPESAGFIQPGDRIQCYCDVIGEMEVKLF